MEFFHDHVTRNGQQDRAVDAGAAYVLRPLRSIASTRSSCLYHCRQPPCGAGWSRASRPGWDTDLLASERAELVGDFDLGTMGFNDAELQEILGTPDAGSDEESAPDKTEDRHNDTDEPVPDTPVRPVSRTGDVWRLATTA